MTLESIGGAGAASPSDVRIVLRCQLGERAAFHELAARWSAPLHRYATRLVNDPHDAMDLAQEVWLRVLRGIGGLRDPERVRPWIFGIAHRCASDRLRAAYALESSSAELDTLPSAIDLADPDLSRDLEGALGALPVVEREATLLFYIEGLTLVEIAAALGAPLGTVKSRLFRARAIIRQQLSPEHTA